MEFWRYYQVLKRRLWLVGVAVLIGLAAMLAFNRPRVGDYTASATLSVPTAQRFFFITGGEAPGPPRTDVALGLVRSREVADRVVQRLNPGVTPWELQRRTETQKDPVTGLIRVTLSGRSPAEAVLLANGVADVAAAYDQEVQRREVTLGREFIEKQVANVHADLQAAEDAVTAFQQQNGVGFASSIGAQIVALQNAARQVDLQIQWADARLDAVRAQLNGQTVTRAGEEITTNPVVVAQQLHAALVQLEVALTSEQALHTDRFPTVVAIKARIQAIKDRLKTELSRINAGEQVRFNPVYALDQARINLETYKRALQAEKENLRQPIDAAYRAFSDRVRKQAEQIRLTRAADVLNRQYLDLESQLATARLRELEAQNLGSLSVVDHARTAELSPFRALRFKLTLASVLGLLGGFGTVFFLEYLDVSVKTPENAARQLGIPVLGGIPRHNPPFDDAYQLLRMNLGASECGGEVSPALLVTSLRPAAGTSTIVANLARAFARAGRRTIVVDAALRRPVQHVQFGVPNEKGFVQVLAGEASLSDTLVSAEQNLWVLPNGGNAEALGNLLGSSALTAVVADLRRLGDVVLIDSSSAGAFADVFSLAPHCSGVLLVLDARQVLRGTEEQVKVQFERLGARVLGVVVSKVRPDLVDSYVYKARFYKDRRSRRFAPAATAAGMLVLVAMVALGARASSVAGPGGGGGRGDTGPAIGRWAAARVDQVGRLIVNVEQGIARWVFHHQE